MVQFKLNLPLKFTATIISALVMAPGAHGAPAATRDVFSPPILYPHAGTVWHSFQRHNVTWDTSGAPASISNEALLLLAKGGLTAPFILAKGFDLRAGRFEIEVPHVFAGTNYQLVLLGDSGNLSPMFTIESDTAE
ncbi:hypothetical protein GGX14DRAFT_362367 [Mycena pura]|uniref:Uncharacterized protein n=1 Tax=Mycena pura TaxID=153505 RepID=A0AAD6VJE4_9AGAR|nr:hypothetical protein GGX14DRAFT_362367 [Mycena pura]